MMRVLGGLLMTNHLGGFIPSDDKHPHGDPYTWTPLLWDWFIEYLHPKNVLDLGCGEGHAARYFLEKGLLVCGVDGSVEAYSNSVIPKQQFVLFDIIADQSNFCFDVSFDLVWCCEFVEHVEEKYVERVLDMLCCGKHIAMTHAFPGQNGHHHVNCQLPEYWIDMLAARNFSLDWPMSMGSRILAPNTHWQRSGLVFHKTKDLII